MAFKKNNWKSGDVISSAKLNAMEDGIAEALTPVAWSNVTGKPTTFAPATHTHAWADVTGKPATFAPTIGATATTAKAGNYVPTYAEITGKPTTFAPAAHTHTIANVTGLQDLLDDLETRLAALETPTPAG